MGVQHTWDEKGITQGSSGVNPIASLSIIYWSVPGGKPVQTTQHGDNDSKCLSPWNSLN